MNIYESGYIGYCYNVDHTHAISIFWKDDTVVGYSCEYPDCCQACELLEKFPIGFKKVYPKKRD